MNTPVSNRYLQGTTSDVAAWLSSTAFTSAHIFGSLIYRDGAQFDPAISDVDIVCSFPKDQRYLGRWRTLAAAEPKSLTLNSALLQRFARRDASKPIASLVAITTFELQNGLHKDKAPQFFSHNAFCSVIDGSVRQIGAEHTPSAPDLEGVLDAAREAQRQRNRYLAVAPNGSRLLGPYTGPDVLPKDFLRAAAQVRWAYENRPDADDRFDVNEGLVYAMQLLVARRNEAAEVNDLLQRFVVRMGGRGEPTSLSSADQVLLWEILFDEATGVFAHRGSAPSKLARKVSRPRVTVAVRREVFESARYKCAFPGCGVPLPPDGIGQLSHIESASRTGARFNPNLSEDERVSPANFVLLCPTHHRLIDSQAEIYSANELRAWRMAAIREKRSGLTTLLTSKDLFTLVRFMLDVLT